MKSPFAILLAAVAIVGIVIGVAAILLLGPSDQDEETIPAASRSELPTPSTRPASERTRPESETAPSETGETATDESTDLDVDDESIETEPVVVEVVVDEAPDQGRPGGFGGGGGPGGGNFQAIQEAMASNPELAELFQKAQSGSITQEEQTRMRELMQELLAESGIEIPGGGQGGGGFGTPPTQGTISAISGSTITIDHNDDSGLSTDVEITDNTNISVISQLTPADLTEGTNVAGTVQRGEGGRIFIVNLTVVPEQQSGGFRGLFGASFPGGNDATNLSNINGTIAEINEQTISVGTAQGTLRLTANEDSNIISTSPGSLSDITEGMAAIAFGGSQDNTPIQPRNLVVGPESLLVDN